jgi:hypothetical protein
MFRVGKVDGGTNMQIKIWSWTRLPSYRRLAYYTLATRVTVIRSTNSTQSILCNQAILDKAFKQTVAESLAVANCV